MCLARGGVQAVYKPAARNGISENAAGKSPALSNAVRRAGVNAAPTELQFSTAGIPPRKISSGQDCTSLRVRIAIKLPIRPERVHCIVAFLSTI